MQGDVEVPFTLQSCSKLFTYDICFTLSLLCRVMLRFPLPYSPVVNSLPMVSVSHYPYYARRCWGFLYPTVQSCSKLFAYGICLTLSLLCRVMLTRWGSLQPTVFQQTLYLWYLSHLIPIMQGDVEVPFTLQSCSKPFTYGICLTLSLLCRVMLRFPSPFSPAANPLPMVSVSISWGQR